MLSMFPYKRDSTTRVVLWSFNICPRYKRSLAKVPRQMYSICDANGFNYSKRMESTDWKSVEALPERYPASMYTLISTFSG